MQRMLAILALASTAACGGMEGTGTTEGQIRILLPQPPVAQSYLLQLELAVYDSTDQLIARGDDFRVAVEDGLLVVTAGEHRLVGPALAPGSSPVLRIEVDREKKQTRLVVDGQLAASIDAAIALMPALDLEEGGLAIPNTHPRTSPIRIPDDFDPPSVNLPDPPLHAERAPSVMMPALELEEGGLAIPNTHPRTSPIRIPDEFDPPSVTNPGPPIQVTAVQLTLAKNSQPRRIEL